MILSYKQKRYIKKNNKFLSTSEIAKNLNIPEQEILSYLKDRWGEEKYNKFMQNKLKNTNQQESIRKDFSLRTFIKSNWLNFILLSGLILLVYFNSLNNVMLSDDIGAIRDNPDIGKFNSVISQPQAFVQPLIYYFIYHIAGKSPIAYRLVNILFHIGTVWAIYLLFGIMIGSEFAFFVASIFSVHPILIESVAWISGGNYVRYSFFFLVSLIFYILSKKNTKYYLWSIIFFALSIFSSEKAVVLFLVYILYEISYSSIKEIKENWKKLIPFTLIAGFLIVFYVNKIGQRMNDISKQTYKTATVQNPFQQVPAAISSYLQLIFWPDKLTLYHSELFYSPFNFTIRVLVTLIVIGLIVYSFFKNKYIFFWLSFFIISLLPTLTPFMISWVVAERYAYLATLGIVAIIAYGVFYLIKLNLLKSFSYLLLIIIIVSFSIRTFIRNIDWKNEDNLWVATANFSPSSPNTHNNMGDVYYRHQEYDKAVEEFQLAIKINPQYAEAFHNLANTYIKMNRMDDALNSYLQAIKFNPGLWQTYRNIGILYYILQQNNNAIIYLNKAIEINPGNSSLYSELGIILATTNQKTQAKENFLKALQLDPNNQLAQTGLKKL